MLWEVKGFFNQCLPYGFVFFTKNPTFFTKIDRFC